MKTKWEIYWELVKEERLIQKMAGDYIIMFAGFLLGCVVTAELNSDEWNEFISQLAIVFTTSYFTFHVLNFIQHLRRVNRKEASEE